MKLPELFPALFIAVLVTEILARAQLMPFGRAELLVRVPAGAPEAALAAAIVSNAALISIPAPGFAILYGDASRIRRALGLAVAWNGKVSYASGS